MLTHRRLADTLQKFQEAREQLIREMGAGQPLAGGESSRQMARLRDLHDAVMIMKAAAEEADAVNAGRELRAPEVAAQEERRQVLLRRAPPVVDDHADFQPL